ncbi:MAG: phasin family protein [Xanthomonadales bacterium]|nr:phasin family protein [Xanthomonadales bacterium]
MAEKKLKKLSKKRSGRKASAPSIKDSASQIWLAGLGAFNRAQEEGEKIFETLVKEGLNIESKTRKLTSTRVNEVRGAVEGTVSQVQATANKSWDRLENIFEKRVARAMAGLGVPTAEEIRKLTKRVEELQKAVSDLGGKPAPRARKKAAKKKATKKVAKKTAARKKVVKKVARKVVRKR